MSGGGKTYRYVPMQVAQEWAWTLQRQEMDPDEIVWQALEENDQNPETMHWRPPKDDGEAWEL